MVKCGCAGSASGGVGVADTPSINLQILNSIITGNVKLDPNPDNLLEILAGGLNIDCADVAACIGTAADVGVLDSEGINFTTSGAGTPGNPRIISGDTIARFYQTSAITFSHLIAAAANTYEKITELPDLILTVPGLYIVTTDVVGVATNTGSSGLISTSIYAQLRRDGVAVPNTETRLASVIQGTAAAAQPSLGVASTGSSTRAVVSTGGTALSVWAAYAETTAANDATITSDAVGRTRITAWRIGA